MVSSSPIKGHLETERGLKKPPRKSVPGLACSLAFTTYLLCVGSALMAPSLGFLVGGSAGSDERWKHLVLCRAHVTSNTCRISFVLVFSPCIWEGLLSIIPERKAFALFLRDLSEKGLFCGLPGSQLLYFQVPYCNLNPCGFSEFRDGWEYRSTTGRLHPGVGSTE